jgi:hypothetical protein
MIMQQEDGMSNLAASVREAPLLSKCSSFNKPATIRMLKLDIAKEVVGHPFSKELFPKCVNLSGEEAACAAGLIKAPRTINNPLTLA